MAKDNGQKIAECFQTWKAKKEEAQEKIMSPFGMAYIRDQARGRIGRNSRPRGRNFALNGTQGEVGVSLKEKKFFFFFFFF